jgi:hypothetical protein
MPDDLYPIGLRFFSRDEFQFIADDNAVRNTLNVLTNETAFKAAFEGLIDGPAFNAVTEAAARKNELDPNEPRDLDTPDLGAFTEGTDFWL